MEDVAQELRRRLTEAGVPAERLPDAALWAKTPKMTLDQWRLLIGMEKQSVQGEIVVQCDDRTLPAQLHLSMDRVVRELSALPVAGVDEDFRGNPLPKRQPLVGPLQGLGDGENAVILEASHPASPQR